MANPPYKYNLILEGGSKSYVWRFFFQMPIWVHGLPLEIHSFVFLFELNLLRIFPTLISSFLVIGLLLKFDRSQWLF